jgi:hypothetical protein
MKNSIYSLGVFLFVGIICQAQSNKWTVLFDGKSIDQLRGYKMTTFPDQAWKVEDEALVAQTGVANVDFITKENYKDFELEFDWKTSVGGNSGVFYHVKEVSDHQSGNGNSPNWLNDFEMQLLDDIGFNDKAPIRSAGSLYDLIMPTNKQLKPVGEYNTSRLIVKGNHVEHWLNGNKILEYEAGSDAMNKLIKESKFKNNLIFGKSTDGFIMFQHHGQKVWFKNIKVRKL